MLGQLATTVTGTEAFEGFHTIDLLSLVSLSQGQDFYIELQTSNGKQANDGNILKLQLLDINLPGYANTSAQPDESFFSDNGTNWTDLQTVDASANFAIDGLTIVTVPEPASLAMLLALAACGLGYSAFRRARVWSR